MTAIAVKITDDGIHLVTDSYGETSNYKWNNQKKIYQTGNIVFAGAGFTSENKLFEEFCIHNKVSGISCVNILEYMSKFADFREKIMRLKNVKEAESPHTFNEYIFVVDNKVFFIHYGEREIRQVKNYFAIGAGGQIATAILADGGTAKHAVEIACKISKGCELPIQEIFIKKGKK